MNVAPSKGTGRAIVAADFLGGGFFDNFNRLGLENLAQAFQKMLRIDKELGGDIVPQKASPPSFSQTFPRNIVH